jgi:hypothetical protein
MMVVPPSALSFGTLAAVETNGLRPYLEAGPSPFDPVTNLWVNDIQKSEIPVWPEGLDDMAWDFAGTSTCDRSV